MLNLEDEAVERRIHDAIKSCWPLVNVLFVSDAAKNEVGGFALASPEEVQGKGLMMIFALQTAWPFVHGSKDEALKQEVSALLRHDFSPSQETSTPKLQSKTWRS